MKPPRRKVPMRLQALRFATKTERWLRRKLSLDTTVYVDARVSEYRRHWADGASSLGATLVPLSKTIWEVRKGDRSVRIANYMAGPDDSVTRRIAGDKRLCYRLATEVGVPVPEHRAFTLGSIGRAEAFLDVRSGPFVVKPLRDSASGLGVTLHVRTSRQLRNAAALASTFSDDLLVETMCPGESYRLLYVGGTLIHAVRRGGQHVIGDGIHRIDELLAGRRSGPLTDIEAETLRRQGMSSRSTPAAGARVLINGSNSGSVVREQRTIYDELATHLISPALDAEAKRVVARVGSAFAGVDVLTVDPGRSLLQTGGVFLEINTTPGIHHHYVPGEQEPGESVAAQVLRFLLSLPPVASAPATLSPLRSRTHAQRIRR